MSEMFQKLLKHTAIYSISEIASRAVGFMLIPLYTQYLTPADYGVLEILFITQSILLIFANQGTGSSLFKFWSDSELEGKKRLGSSCLWYALFSSVLIAGAGSFFADRISLLLLETAAYGYLFRFVFLALVFNLIQQVLRQILRARLESLKVSVISLVKLFCALGFNIYFIVVLNLGMMSIVLADLISSAVAMGAGFWFARRFVGFSFSFEDVKKLVVFGYPLIGGGLASWILSVSDRYFLAHYSTPTELGLYSFAYKFSAVLSLIMLHPFLTTWPSIYFDAAKRPEAKEFFSRMSRYFALVFCVAGVGLLLLSNISIRVLSPPNFWASTQVVYLLVGAVILEGLYNIFISGLFLQSGAKYTAIFTAIAAAINLVLNLLLIPQMGMFGAAIATLISYAVLVCLTYRTAQKRYPVPYPWKSISACVIAFHLVGAASTAIPPRGTVFDSLIALVIFVCSVFTAFYSPMLTQSERQTVVSLLKTVRADGVSGTIKRLRTASP